jgi:hypothetical protein
MRGEDEHLGYLHMGWRIGSINGHIGNIIYSICITRGLIDYERRNPLFM